MLILGIDVETTGLDYEKDRITELGYIVYDTEEKQQVDIFNQLVNAEDRPAVSPEITRLTGITETMLTKHGITEEQLVQLIYPRLCEVDYIFAHHAEFDRGMVTAMLRRYRDEELEKPWICTSKDMPYPDTISTRKLVHLAAEHNFVNPMAHRAIYDVMTMMKILLQYDIEEVIALSKEPEFVLEAKVSYDDRDLAKQRGYRWDSERKKWLKTVKQRYLEKEVQGAGFAVHYMERKC